MVAAAILTLMIAFVCGGAVWLALGPRLAFARESDQNAVLNLLAYVVAALLPAFLVVFFLLEAL